MFSLRKSILASCMVLWGATTAQSATLVDVELSLLVDVSGSVDTNEFTLQRQGYVNAFQDSVVINSILSTANGRLGKIAAQVVFWSGATQQAAVVPWVLLDSAASISTFATAISTAPRTFTGSTTAIGSAITFATAGILANDFTGQGVIDVSGDGTNNDGVSVTAARDASVLAGNRINGIAIQAGTSNSLLTYYQNNVIGGAGSFALGTQDFQTFDQAIRLKLANEIVGTSPVPVPAAGILLISAVGGMTLMRRRRNQKTA